MNCMQILVVWPPHVPSYFNAGHHLNVFMVAQHLRNAGHDVDAIDAGALNYTWKAIGDHLMRKPGVLAIANEFDGVDGLERLIKYTRELTPKTRIVTFGRLSAVLPEYFRNYDLDAIVAAGDPEAGVLDFVEGRVSGIWTRSGGGWLPPKAPLPFLPSDELPLPDVREIPYSDYERLYADDTARFCGIPGRRELVVPIARGCPVGCDFCDIPGREGLKDRRLSPRRAVGYIQESVRQRAFDYVSMYAPTFTINRKWVEEFCRIYAELGVGLPWKCTTTLHHINPELLSTMAGAGCVRVSVGLETLDPEGHAALPRLKRMNDERFREIVAACQHFGIELNCFVILGLPGSDLKGVRHTIAEVENLGGRVRPTIYTRFDQMSADMTALEISGFNRQLFRTEDAPAESDEYYKLLFNPSAGVTRVAEKIPRRSDD